MMAEKMEVTFGQFGLILPSSRLLSIPQFLWKEQHMMENEDSCGISLWINLVTCPLCNVLLLKVPFEINKNVDVPCVMPLETRLLVVLEVVVILLLLCLHSSILLLPWLLMFPALHLLCLCWLFPIHHPRIHVWKQLNAVGTKTSCCSGFVCMHMAGTAFCDYDDRCQHHLSAGGGTNDETPVKNDTLLREADAHVYL